MGTHSRRLLITGLFLLITLPPVTVVAQQSRIDRLHAELNRAALDTNRVNIFVSLCLEYRNRNPQTAVDYGLQALSLADQIPFQRGLARTYVALAEAYFYLGEDSIASEYFERGLKFAEEKEEGRTISVALQGLGKIRMRRGNYQGATAFFTQEQGIALAAKDPLGTAQALNNLGMIASARSNTSEAESLFKRSLNLKEDLKDTLEIAATLNNLGVLYDRVGKYDLSIEYYLRSLEQRKAVGDSVGIAGTLSNIGLLHYKQGAYEPAVDYFEKSLSIREKLKDKAGRAIALNNLGMTYWKLNRLDEALRFYSASLLLKEELKDPSSIAGTLNNIGLILMSRNKFDEAQAHFERAYELYLSVKSRNGMAQAYNNLGLNFANQGSDAEAIALGKQALTLGRAIDSKERIKESLVLLTECAARQKDFAHAYEYYREYSSVKDSLNRVNVNVTVAAAQAGQKERRIDELEKVNESRALELLAGKNRLLETQLQAELRARQIIRLENEKEIEKLESEKARSDLAVIRSEADKKSRELGLMKRNQQLQQSVLERENNLRNILIVILFLALITALFIYTRYRQRKILSDQLDLTITHLKDTQSQLVHSEKLASLGQLTAGIAHEIKNPLNFVTNFSQVSKELVEELETATSDEERKALQDSIILNLSRIEEHGKRADGIVKNMLMHVRGERGTPEMVDIHQLLDDALNLSFHGMRSRYPGFDVSMQKQYDKAVPHVELISQSMSRVFFNIFGNAFDAVVKAKDDHGNEDYKPSISVQTIFQTASPKQGGRVEIRIRDNGHGVPENLQRKIFEPFFTTKPAGQGTGLGLSISHEIIAIEHGGELLCHSRDGEGTAFIIRLPVQYRQSQIL